MSHRDWKSHSLAAVGALLTAVLLTACNRPTPTGIPTTLPPTEIATVPPSSEVRRELEAVWAGPDGSDPISLPLLEDSSWRNLPAGGWVFTDNDGEGWVRINDCMLLYIFQLSRLRKAACPKSDYQGGNVTCAIEGTSVYNNQCASQIIIQTPGAQLVLEGTWLSVTYLPGHELTLIIVFEGQVKVQPILDAETYTLGEAVNAVGGQFWFSTPGVTADPIAGLAARELHPFDQLLPVVEELNVWHWIERIKNRADADNIPYPLIPPFVPAPTPTPSPETPTLISQVTPVPITQTPIATPCGPPPGWVVYVAQASDTLFSLATKSGTTVEQVKRANCLVGDTVFVGQRLYLPFIPATPTPTATPCGPPPNWVVYVVQASDTLFSLATKTGTTVEQIKRANCLVGDTVFVGQRLYLPFIPATPTPTPTPTVTPSPTPSFPDLVIPNLETTGPATINPEGDIVVPIRVVIRNQGGAAADIFKVSTEVTFHGTSVVPFTVPGQASSFFPSTSAPLAPAGEVTFAGTVTLGRALQGRTVTLSTMADSCIGDELMPEYCRVRESDEGNNVRSIPLSLPNPPAAPSDLNYDRIGCGPEIVIVWRDNADNEDGYRIYRNGEPIAALPPGANAFTDREASSDEYTYGVAAFNVDGQSETITITVPGCVPPG